MKASELQSYLRTLNGGWMNLERTVDTFKFGDPESEIRGLAVSWMSSTDALEKAVLLGCNVFLTHEPTFYEHREKESDQHRFPAAREKRRFLEGNGLVVLRCHDLWDQIPDIGIPDSWGKFLGLGDPVDGVGWFRVYDGGGRRAAEIARQVADRCRAFGQEAVQLIGPEERKVSRLCLGTGAITPFLTEFVGSWNADMGICSDDGFNYWRDGYYARDAGITVVIVNHAVSEEAGVMGLAEHLRGKFPNIPVHHIPQRCPYRLVAGTE